MGQFWRMDRFFVIVCEFLFVKTGTGKTYTMVGKLETPKAGLMSRSLDDIFYRLNQDDRYSYSVKLAYL